MQLRDADRRRGTRAPATTEGPRGAKTVSPVAARTVLVVAPDPEHDPASEVGRLPPGAGDLIETTVRAQVMTAAPDTRRMVVIAATGLPDSAARLMGMADRTEGGRAVRVTVIGLPAAARSQVIVARSVPVRPTA